jgi:dienelactone hydrolase
MHSRAAILVACLCSSGIPSAAGQVPAEAVSDSLSDHLVRLEPFFDLRLPDAPIPHPIVVTIPGCSGFHAERFRDSYDRDSDRLVGLGYAVIRVDYVRAHGLDSSCPGPQDSTADMVPDADIAQYIQATVTYLDDQANIDRDRMYLFASSLGGAGVFTAMADAEWVRRQDLAAALMYFPVCRAMSPWETGVPLLLMLGQLDNIQPPQYCRDLANSSPRREQISLIEYPQAHHCFNAEDVPIVTEPRDEDTCAYNPEALDSSWRDIRAFLGRH